MTPRKAAARCLAKMRTAFKDELALCYPDEAERRAFMNHTFEHIRIALSRKWMKKK